MERMESYIIIVNYNNWRDTIICVEDLVRKQWEDYTIIVVDNGSSDRSVRKIEDYQRGALQGFIKNNFPNWKKENSSVKNSEREIIFIESDENKGFAYGNNLGIKKAFELEGDSEFFVWLLNNDTVTHSQSLPELKKLYKSDRYGLIGSKILNFEPPHETQALYGSFNRYLGRVKVEKKYEKNIAYPIGASLFTHSNIVKEVGFLDEGYFLYYEELDYSIRLQRNGYKIGVADQSIVYHKQGATTQSKKGKKKKNLKTEQHKYASLKRFYLKNFSKLQYAAYLHILLKGSKLMLNFQFKNAALLFKSLFVK